MLVLEVSVAKGLLPRHTSNHRQSVRPSTRFKRLPVWVRKAHIVAYVRLGPTDAASSVAALDPANVPCGAQDFPPSWRLCTGGSKWILWFLVVAPVSR